MKHDYVDKMFGLVIPPGWTESGAIDMLQHELGQQGYPRLHGYFELEGNLVRYVFSSRDFVFKQFT